MPNKSTFQRFILDFRTFLFSGNLVEIAVAFVVATATAKLIAAFIDNVASPIIGLIMPGAAKSLATMLDFNGVRIGAFLSAGLDFVMLGLVVFVIVRLYEKRRAIADEKYVDDLPATLEQSSGPGNAEILETLQAIRMELQHANTVSANRGNVTNIVNPPGYYAANSELL